MKDIVEEARPFFAYEFELFNLMQQATPEEVEAILGILRLLIRARQHEDKEQTL